LGRLTGSNQLHSRSQANDDKRSLQISQRERIREGVVFPVDLRGICLKDYSGRGRHRGKCLTAEHFYFILI